MKVNTWWGRGGTWQPHLAKSQRCSGTGTRCVAKHAPVRSLDNHDMMHIAIGFRATVSIAALQDSVFNWKPAVAAVLSLHVRADAVTREAATAVAADAAPRLRC